MLLFSKSDHFFNALSALDLTYHMGQPEFDNESQVCTYTATVSSHKQSTIARHTCGVSGVDDAEDTGIAVLPGFSESSPELCNIQTPTIILVQVVVDLHRVQVCQGG